MKHERYVYRSRREKGLRQINPQVCAPSRRCRGGVRSRSLGPFVPRASCINPLRRLQDFPQGLKPRFLCALSGTTEVVP